MDILQYFISNWEKLTSDVNILKIVKGYKITFFTIVYQSKKVAVRHYQNTKLKFDDNAIEKLLKMGAISQCNLVKKKKKKSIYISFLFKRKTKL